MDKLHNHRRDLAKKLFDELEQLGCRRETTLFTDKILFDTDPEVRLREARTIAHFARAVRSLTNLEKANVVLPETDTASGMVGWRFRRELSQNGVANKV